MCDTVAVSDTLRRLYYMNPWVTLDGVITDSVRGRIESRDTLVQIYSRITYTEYIELKRRNKK